MGDWLDALGGYAQQGADIYATVAGAKKNNIPEPTKTTATTPAWLMPALIGGGLLVVVLVFVGFSKK